MPPPFAPKANFNQGTELHRIPHANQGGVCWALAMKWVSLHIATRTDKTDAQFLSRMDALRNDFVDLCNSAQLVMGEVRGDAALAALDSVKKREQTVTELGINFGVKLGGAGRSWSRTTFVTDKDIDDMTDVLWATHTYHIASFGFNLGRHATACYASSGKVFGFGKHIYYFDPNYGEFKVDKAEFKQLMTYFRDRKYRLIKDFTCIPVAPR